MDYFTIIYISDMFLFLQLNKISSDPLCCQIRRYFAAYGQIQREIDTRGHRSVHVRMRVCASIYEYEYIFFFVTIITTMKIKLQETAFA